jgi:hypothetical protein
VSKQIEDRPNQEERPNHGSPSTSDNVVCSKIAGCHGPMRASRYSRNCALHYVAQIVASPLGPSRRSKVSRLKNVGSCVVSLVKGTRESQNKVANWLGYL